MPSDPVATAARRERERIIAALRGHADRLDNVVAWLIRVNNVIRTGGLSLRRQVPRD